MAIKHKIDHPVDVFPERLIAAVRVFIAARAARAIRNARGQQAGHATMLGNASGFMDAQGRLRSRIADVVARIRDALAVDAAKGPVSLRKPEIAALHETWQREFSGPDGADWPSVRARLPKLKYLEIRFQTLTGGSILYIRLKDDAQMELFETLCGDGLGPASGECGLRRLC